MSGPPASGQPRPPREPTTALLVRRLALLAMAVALGLSLLQLARRDRRRSADVLPSATLLDTASPGRLLKLPEPLRLAGAVVRGAAKGWYVDRHGPPSLGEPVPVEVTMYCLTGTTRRGRYVRPGIVAADPRYFPLARYIELYIGRRYLGRFLVDDTGLRITGARIDVWTPACSDARRFGRQRGTAALVPRPRPDSASVRQAGEARPGGQGR